MPSSRPPSTAPKILPKPPITTATKPTSTGVRPIVGETCPVCITSSTPTTAASAPLIAKAIAITRSARTPSSRAISKFSAAARIASPVRVR